MTVLEKHYTVAEIAEAWNLSLETVQKMFRDEEGVFVIEAAPSRKRKRHAKTTLRIPESVLLRVYQERSR